MPPPRKPARPSGPTLFEASARRSPEARAAVPLAERMRPRLLAEIAGQAHLLGPGRPLARAIEADRTPSMILWGPPGTGKTTIARVLAERTRARFVPYSAVMGSIAELRGIFEDARQARGLGGERTILFVDEIHRFNKAQQDAFLPEVESGNVTLVGATTENPSFSVNAALLSRCRVFRLERVGEEDLARLLERALRSPEGLGGALSAEPEALMAIARAADGDARRALGLLEGAAAEASGEGSGAIGLSHVAAGGERALLYDRAGEEHYNLSSAFIKSMRGSDPDAAVYYLLRMLDAGEDPLFLLRRMMIFASEDVGNADPRALELAVSADHAFRRMGMPEGLYPLSHAAIYLACAPKSNAVKKAWHAARAAIEEKGSLPVPMKLRNAVTRLMKDEGYGEGYRYAHDEASGVAEGETYLPDALSGARFYEPTERGLEKQIAEKLRRLRGEH